MKRPIAYITAPWGENEFENTENAAKYCRAVYDAGFSPICPMLFLPLFLSDEIPQEHKDGIRILMIRLVWYVLHYPEVTDFLMIDAAMQLLQE